MRRFRLRPKFDHRRTFDNNLKPRLTTHRQTRRFSGGRVPRQRSIEFAFLPEPQSVPPLRNRQTQTRIQLRQIDRLPKSHRNRHHKIVPRRPREIVALVALRNRRAAIHANADVVVARKREIVRKNNRAHDPARLARSESSFQKRPDHDVLRIREILVHRKNQFRLKRRRRTQTDIRNRKLHRNRLPGEQVSGIRRRTARNRQIRRLVNDLINPSRIQTSGTRSVFHITPAQDPAPGIQNKTLRLPARFSRNTRLLNPVDIERQIILLHRAVPLDPFRRNTPKKRNHRRRDRFGGKRETRGLAIEHRRALRGVHTIRRDIRLAKPRQRIPRRILENIPRRHLDIQRLLNRNLTENQIRHRREKIVVQLVRFRHRIAGIHRRRRVLQLPQRNARRNRHADLVDDRFSRRDPEAFRKANQLDLIPRARPETARQKQRDVERRTHRHILQPRIRNRHLERNLVAGQVKSLHIIETGHPQIRPAIDQNIGHRRNISIVIRIEFLHRVRTIHHQHQMIRSRRQLVRQRQTRPVHKPVVRVQIPEQRQISQKNILRRIRPSRRRQIRRHPESRRQRHRRSQIDPRSRNINTLPLPLQNIRSRLVNRATHREVRQIQRRDLQPIDKTNITIRIRAFHKSPSQNGSGLHLDTHPLPIRFPRDLTLKTSPAFLRRKYQTTLPTVSFHFPSEGHMTRARHRQLKPRLFPRAEFRRNRRPSSVDSQTVPPEPGNSRIPLDLQIRPPKRFRQRNSPHRDISHRRSAPVVALICFRDFPLPVQPHTQKIISRSHMLRHRHRHRNLHQPSRRKRRHPNLLIQQCRVNCRLPQRRELPQENRNPHVKIRQSADPFIRYRNRQHQLRPRLHRNRRLRQFSHPQIREKRHRAFRPAPIVVLRRFSYLLPGIQHRRDIIISRRHRLRQSHRNRLRKILARLETALECETAQRHIVFATPNPVTRQPKLDPKRRPRRNRARAAIYTFDGDKKRSANIHRRIRIRQRNRNDLQIRLPQKRRSQTVHLPRTADKPVPELAARIQTAGRNRPRIREKKRMFPSRRNFRPNRIRADPNRNIALNARPVAQLPVPVIAPRPERSVVPNRQRMISARRDHPPAAQVADPRRTHLPQNPVPQTKLSLEIPAPRPQSSSLVDRQRMPIPRRNRNPFRSGTNLHRRFVSGNIEPESELPFHIRTPRPNRFIRANRQRMKFPRRDRHPFRPAADLHRRKSRMITIVPQLSRGIAPPRVKLAPFDRHRVIHPRRDRHPICIHAHLHRHFPVNRIPQSQLPFRIPPPREQPSILRNPQHMRFARRDLLKLHSARNRLRSRLRSRVPQTELPPVVLSPRPRPVVAPQRRAEFSTRRDLLAISRKKSDRDRANSKSAQKKMLTNSGNK